MDIKSDIVFEEPSKPFNFCNFDILLALLCDYFILVVKEVDVRIGSDNGHVSIVELRHRDAIGPIPNNHRCESVNEELDATLDDRITVDRTFLFSIREMTVTPLGCVN